MAHLSDIDAFVGVVEHGGFRAAAAKLGVTASAVTKRVAALEDRLGARLLNRTTRRVSPTDVGQAFFERARESLAGLREAEAAVGALQAEPRGRLRLSSPVDFGRRHLASLLAEFAGQHPGVEFDVSFSDRFVDVVAEGFDVVLRIGSLPDSSLVARRLAPCRRVLVAAPAYLERAGHPRSAAELAEHDFLLYAFDQSRRVVVDGESIPMSGRHSVDNGEMLVALAEAGLGVALLPTFLCGDAIRAGRLEILRPGHVAADLTLHAVTAHRQLLSAKVGLLLDRLQGHFGGQRPPWDEGLRALGLE